MSDTAAALYDAPDTRCMRCMYRGEVIGQSMNKRSVLVECLRYPPVWIIKDKETQHASLPQGMWGRVRVRADDTCGEFIDRLNGRTFEELWQVHIQEGKTKEVA